jgi:hypothetical protein
VDCTSCTGTLDYRLAGGTSTPRAISTLDLEVNEEVQKVLREIGREGARYAERTNLCNDYDRFVNHMNSKMPEGLRLPGRLNQWKVKIENATGSLEVEVQASSGNNARDIVRSQIGHYSGQIGNGLRITAVAEVE